MFEHGLESMTKDEFAVARAILADLLARLVRQPQSPNWIERSSCDLVMTDFEKKALDGAVKKMRSVK